MVERKAYLVGSGISSLASAAFLIREGSFAGENIIIIEEGDVTGGSLDGGGDPEKGYVLRGGRMFNFSYLCTYDLLSFIPSLQNPLKSVKEEILEFNRKIKTESPVRLMKNGQKVDSTSMGFSYKDRFDILDIMTKSEESLENRRIQDFFSKEFFETNFWNLWATTFSFQPWHGAVEFKRYLHRFIHEFPSLSTLAGVDRTPYNQFDSIVRPLVVWLKGQGVHFMMETEVTNLEFSEIETQKVVSKIHYRRNEDMNSIPVGEDDLVFVTNGSMTASTSLGSMKTAPLLKSKKEGANWLLWENIAVGRPEFGKPGVFANRVDESKWLSFTVTLKDPFFFRRIEEAMKNKPGTGGMVSFVDSNWLMSVVLPYQPHFPNQPPEVTVFWGNGLFVDRPGNFVKKKMSECTGEEILVELCSHLRLTDDLERILKSANCIPCMMPFITSPFLTHEKTDRPLVLPEGYKNLAFISQFCEIPEDVVFTVDYSVRAAQTAVYRFLNLSKEPLPVYDSGKDLRVLFNSLKTMFRAEGQEPPEEESVHHP